MSLPKSIAHILEYIDPSQNTTRDEGIAMMDAFRRCLRQYVDKVCNNSLLEGNSIDNIGYTLSGTMHEARANAYLYALYPDAFNSNNGSVNSSVPETRICLVKRSTNMIPSTTLDDIRMNEEEKFVAVSTTPYVINADFDVQLHECSAICTLSFPKTRPAYVHIDKYGEMYSLKLVGENGSRRVLPEKPLSRDVTDVLFASKYIPARPHASSTLIHKEFPAFLKLALVDVLRTRVRLEVLLSAALAHSKKRIPRIVIDNVHLKDVPLNRSGVVDECRRCLLQAKCTLHASSTVCVCGAHAETTNDKTHKADCGSSGSGVEIHMETCGRLLVTDANGYTTCPMHKNKVNAMYSYCVACTSISLKCMHRVGSKHRLCTNLESMILDESVTRQIAHILISQLEFEARTRECFINGRLVHYRKMQEVYSSIESAFHREHRRYTLNPFPERFWVRQDEEALRMLKSKAYKVCRIVKDKKCMYRYKFIGETGTELNNMRPQKVVETHGQLFSVSKK
jgi:hypothetical protein